MNGITGSAQKASGVHCIHKRIEAIIAYKIKICNPALEKSGNCILGQNTVYG